jgi:hypothetical protein
MTDEIQGRRHGFLARIAFVGKAWDWFERLWRIVPVWVKTGIKQLLAPALAVGIAYVTGVLMAVLGVVSEFWPLVILSSLAGIGAGFVLRGLGLRLIAALDRVAELRPHSPFGVERLVADRVTLNDIRELLRLHAAEGARWIRELADAAYRDKIHKKTFSTPFLEQAQALEGKVRELIAATDDENPGTADVARSALAAFHKHYMDVVKLVFDCELEGVDLLEDYTDQYRRWEVAHGDYLTKLQTLMQHSEMAPIRPDIKQVGYKDVGDQRWGTMYTKAFRRLENLAPEERDFLMLFCETDAAKLPWGEGLMPGRVYKAGMGLAQCKLLRALDRGDRIEFVITRPLAAAWSWTGPRQPVQRSVEVDLSKVAATMRSGGGAGFPAPRWSAPSTAAAGDGGGGEADVEPGEHTDNEEEYS